MSDEAEVTGEREIKMIQIDLDIDPGIVDKIVEIAKKDIVNDREALWQYGAQKALEEMVKRQEAAEEAQG